MSSTSIRTALLVVGVAMTMVREATSQTIARDPATGNYVLTYTDLRGTTHTVQLEARDRVRPELIAQVTNEGGRIVYRYTLTNHAGAPQSIMAIDIPCPHSDAGLTVTSPATWNAEVVSQGEPPVVVACEFLFRKALLSPGEVVGNLMIQTSFLPSIADARVFGAVETIGLPSPVEDTPDTVYALVRLVQGFDPLNGSGLAVRGVVPVRPPAALADPRAGLDAVAADRAQSCALGWIRDAGVCHSLAEQLEHAQHALARGKPEEAEHELKSFLHELAAQHGAHADEHEEEPEHRDRAAGPGREAGKHVTDNAYWLLKTNVEFILAKL